ncbi:MAG TPA: hypothetical protein VM618_00570, partial [Acidimicrobiia bacterium]|nr:hypothetical protein [Acidimicrobiia bacterium]
MTGPALAVAAVMVTLAPPAAALALRAAGLRVRQPLPARAEAEARLRPEWRLVALVAGLAVAVGLPGDLLVAAVLIALGVSERPWPIAGAVVAVAGAGALRVGSSSIEHVAGGHVVLGPAILSPSVAVAVGASLALAAAVVAVPALLPGRARGGWTGPYRSARSLGDAVAPVAVVLLGVAVALGPPVAEGAEPAV